MCQERARKQRENNFNKDNVNFGKRQVGIMVICMGIGEDAAHVLFAQMCLRKE